MNLQKANRPLPKLDSEDKEKSFPTYDVKPKSQIKDQPENEITPTQPTTRNP